MSSRDARPRLLRASTGVPESRSQGQEQESALVLKFPHLPVERKSKASKHWLVYIGAALALMLVSPVILARSVYYHEVLSLPQDTAAKTLDLDLEVSGCDVLVEPGHQLQNPEARLSYWHFSGSGGMKVVNNTLQVRVRNDRSLLLLRCLLIVLLPEHLADDMPHFGAARLTVAADDRALEVPGYANTAQLISVQLDRLRVGQHLLLNVSTMARTQLMNVSSPRCELIATGGSLSMQGSAMQMGSQVVITAQDAMVFVQQSQPMQVVLTEDTFNHAALAAPSVREEGTPGSSSAHAAQWQRSFSLQRSAAASSSAAASARRSALVTMNASSCAVYLQVAENEGHKSCGEERLQVVRGAGLESGSPSLLPAARQTLSNLAKWLAAAGTQDDRYVVYLQLLAPHSPTGLLKLLSSSAYKSLSLASFSLLSGGMLRPNIIKIVAPVIGLNWLFPQGCALADGQAHLKEKDPELRYGEELLNMVDQQLDIHSLGLSSARWNWDPKGRKSYIFEYIPASKGRAASWRPRLINGQDIWAFLAATAITVGMGFVASWAVLKLLYCHVRPQLLSEINKTDLFNSASYRLQHGSHNDSWVLSATLVHWPLRGVFLRWARRPMANQFQSIAFKARPWPVGQAQAGSEGVELALPIVRGKRLEYGMLPAYPEMPDQPCFLFTADPRRDAAPLRGRHMRTDFEKELVALGVMQADQEQASLQSGRPYQFQAVAYNAAGDIVEVSGWSRPTLVEAHRPFLEIPLLMWRGFFGALPSSTFQHFLNTHTTVLPKAPCMTIRLTKLRLAVADDSRLFAGSKAKAYGLEPEKQFVQVSFYTDNGFYKATELMPLDSQEERARKKSVQSFEEVYPGSHATNGRAEGGVPKRLLVLSFDMGPNGMVLEVGNDLGKLLSIEATLITEDGECATTAKWRHSWSHLLDVLQNCSKNEITDEIVLCAGNSPAALLCAKFEISNRILGKPSRQEAFSKSTMPDIFSSLYPSSTIFWGETLKLAWPAPTEELPGVVDILCVGRPLDAFGQAAVKDSKAYSGGDVVAAAVDLASCQTSFVLCPARMRGHPMMCCHLQAWWRNADGSRGNKALSSWQFLLCAPVLLQDLELAYAGFCARNRISMEPVPSSSMPDFGMETVERRFYMIENYRAPLTVPLEKEKVQQCKDSLAEGMAILIENPASNVITTDRKIRLCDPEQLNCATKDKSGSASTIPDKKKVKSKANVVAPVAALSQPLLEGGFATDGGTALAGQANGLVVVPHRECVRIPTNVFWRTDASWQTDLLLKYAALPGFFVGLPHRSAACFRFLCSALLFYLQLASLTTPVFGLFALVVYHDMVHAEVRADIFRRDEPRHFYLLDFLMSPSYFRWNCLSFTDQLIQGILFFYLILVTLAVSYGMVFHVTSPSEIGETYFRKFDRVVECTTLGLLGILVLYVTLVLLWVILGSLIRPADLMPYAIMVGVVWTLSHSLLTKFMSMQQFAAMRTKSMLDHALHAIFSVRSKDPGALKGVEEHLLKFKALQEEVCKGMPLAEAELKKKLFAKAAPALVQETWSLDWSDTWGDVLRSFMEGRRRDDYIVYNPSNEVVDPFTHPPDKNSFPLRFKLKVPDETPQVASSEGDKPDLSSMEEITVLAKKLSLRPETVSVVVDSFQHAMVLKRLGSVSEAGGMSSAAAMSALFAEVRHSTLFSHFLKPEGEDEYEPTVLMLLRKLQNQEMENLDKVVARSLTRCLDWPRIGEQVETFITTTIVDRVINNVVEQELSPVVDGSAAGTVMVAAYELVYLKFESTYRSNPLQMFVDCSIVLPEEIKLEEVRHVLSTLVDRQRSSEGHISAQGLIQAMRSLCLPGDAVALTGAGDPKSYFWFTALIQVLKGLGWTHDETVKRWLELRWKQLTDGLCLFPYSSTREVNTLILKLSDGGLWQAAAKSLLLQTGLCGYVGCSSSAPASASKDEVKKFVEEAGKKAKEIRKADPFNLQVVWARCTWPSEVEDLWKALAVPGEDSQDLDRIPHFLPSHRVMKFLESLIYVPDDQPSQEVVLAPLSQSSDDSKDLVWQVGVDRSLWHVQLGRRRRLRGIWLELAMEIFGLMDCIPDDIDLYLQCQAWRPETQRARLTILERSDWGQPQQLTSLGSACYVLGLAKLRAWLTGVYFKQSTHCTFIQFKGIVKIMLECDIPDKALQEDVFDICPKIEDDDKGELRCLYDLGAALYRYTGHGLWCSAMGMVAKRILPAGPIRKIATSSLAASFAKMDKDQRGVLQPSEALELLENMAVPGLTCDDLSRLLREELGLQVPKAELNKYFTLMDVNHDSVLQSDEFVQTLRFLMLDFFPHHIMRSMSLSMEQISAFVLLVLVVIMLLFLLVTLVVGLFKTAGSGVDSVMHGGVSGIFGVVGKRLSDQGLGFEDTMANLEVKLEALLVEVMAPVIGLSKPMLDQFKRQLANLEDA